MYATNPTYPGFGSRSVQKLWGTFWGNTCVLDWGCASMRHHTYACLGMRQYGAPYLCLLHQTKAWRPASRYGAPSRLNTCQAVKGMVPHITDALRTTKPGKTWYPMPQMPCAPTSLERRGVPYPYMVPHITNALRTTKLQPAVRRLLIRLAPSAAGR